MEVLEVFLKSLIYFLIISIFSQILFEKFTYIKYENENKLLKKEIEILKKQLENKKETEKNDNK